MNTQQIIDALKQEREGVDRAIAALDGSSRGSTAPVARAAPSSSRQRQRHMGAEARKRIAEAQRRRWAKVKAKQTATAVGTAKKK